MAEIKRVGTDLDFDFSMGQKPLKVSSKYSQVGVQEISGILDATKQTQNGYRIITLWLLGDQVTVREKNGKYDIGPKTASFLSLDELISSLGEGELTYHQRGET